MSISHSLIPYLRAYCPIPLIRLIYKLSLFCHDENQYKHHFL